MTTLSVIALLIESSVHKINDFFLVDFDGLFVSNGPGDPSICSKTVEHIRQYISSRNGTKPVFGICLGHQLICRAIGTPTFKMKSVHSCINCI